MATYYMHTVDRRPAYFDGEVLVLAGGYGKSGAAVLCTSLRQVRREQRACKAWYAANLPRTRDEWKYGYVRVTVPGGGEAR